MAAQLADLDLDEFVQGILAVLAYRGKTRLQLVAGVLDVALAQTMDVVAKQMARERLQPTFRLGSVGGKKLHAGLQASLGKLRKAGHIRDDGEWTILAWNPHDAFLWLSATVLPLNFLERAAKVFYGQHETARIRRSLHRIATRPKTASGRSRV
jgi:hypothetical protein